LHGAEQLIHRMQHHLVQTECEARAERNGGGGAEQWEERCGRGNRECDGESVGGDAKCELLDNRVDDAPLPERPPARIAGNHARRHCASV
jgi:hypothetical protein